MEPDDSALREAHAFIAALDEVDLARYRIVGTYTRYDEAVRNALQDARQKILAGFEPPGRKRENHLIWAAPGTGKTYFVQQIAASLGDGVRYTEINLAKSAEPEFRAALGRLDSGQPCLCLIDEVDAKPQEPWPYEVLLPYLDAAVERGARFVFILVGSSGTSLGDIKQRIATRPKGTDLLSRIPTGHEHVIGPMSLGDRLLIVLSQLRQAGQERGRDIRAIEKLGLYYVALNERLANARQLREFAVRAVERVPKTDHRVKYDHLFTPGDPENRAFWVQAQPVVERLVNSFVVLAGDGVAATPTSTDVAATLRIGTVAFPPTVAAAARPRTNLPRQLTSFIGREREIAEVKGLLPATGLLTITGAAGAGKTRLAQRVAEDLLDEYPDGIWLAQLGPLSEPSLVPKAIASALDVDERPGLSLTETIADYLQPRTVLIVLDNCEHLLQTSADLVSTLLRKSPNLRILATSREVFGIEGELVYRIPSLSVPDPQRLPPPDVLTQYDAVRLFVERAAFSKPGFEITSGNAAAVAKVTHRLDGIPLAIELAAARVKALSMDMIAERLDDRFRLLTGGSRTGLPRHQALQATLDWSYDLLSEQERTLFRRLSVFAGGFTLEAAENICVGDEVNADSIVDLLTRLVDKSLLTFDERDGMARLLESVRAYGRDRLQESRDTAVVRTRHRDWYLGLAECADLGLRGPEQTAWSQRLETEHDNLRVALEWSTRDESDAEAGLRLAWALMWFWLMRGYISEGRDWLEKMVPRGSGAAALVRARVLSGAGALSEKLGDYEHARARLGESLTIFRQLNDLWGAGFAIHFLAHISRAQGDFAHAAAMFEESLALFRGADDRWGCAFTLDCWGATLVSQGEYSGAASLYEESVALFREIGDKREIAGPLSGLGLAAAARGDYVRATHLLEESLAIVRETGSDSGATSLLRLGRVVFRQGNMARAAALFKESMVLRKTRGDKDGIAACLTALAGVAVEEKRPEQAARLFGAAEALRETIHTTLPPAQRPEYDRHVAALVTSLNDTVLATIWAEGRAMTLEQAIEYALVGQTE